MSPRILRLKGQGRVDHCLGARDVACRVVAPAIERAIDQSLPPIRTSPTRFAGREPARARTKSRRRSSSPCCRGKLDLASACIARSAASGLFGRSRIGAKGFGLDELDARANGRDGIRPRPATRQACFGRPRTGRPTHAPGLGRNELCVDFNPFAEAADAAFEHVAHAEILADLLGANELALVCERCAVSDHEGVLQLATGRWSGPSVIPSAK